MTEQKTFWGTLPGRKIAHLWTPWGWASIGSSCGLHRDRGIIFYLQTDTKCKSCLRALER